EYVNLAGHVVLEAHDLIGVGVGRRAGARERVTRRIIDENVETIGRRPGSRRVVSGDDGVTADPARDDVVVVVAVDLDAATELLGYVGEATELHLVASAVGDVAAEQDAHPRDAAERAVEHQRRVAGADQRVEMREGAGAGAAGKGTRDHAVLARIERRD